VHQAANGAHTSYDALIDLLGSIEHVLSRLRIYTQISPTPALDELVVKIMVELLSILALATKEVKQGRPSESRLVDELPYSVQHSNICKEAVWREGCRGSPAEAGPTNAGGGSDDSGGDSQGRIWSRPGNE
jgi:hypothetical protein